MKPKRLISLLLAVCMVIAMLPVSAFAADTLSFTVDDIQYTVDENDSTAVAVTDATGYSDKTNKKDLVLPEKVDYNGVTYTVTSIGKGAFSQKQGLNSIVIPNTVTYIAESAFASNWGLTSIEIPASVVEIGTRAFEWAGNIQKVTFAENSQLKIIGTSAFSHAKGLKEIVLPEGLTTIKNCAFADCNVLESVTIPASVTTIMEHMFDNPSNPTGGCPMLKTVKYEGTKEQWDKINLGENNNVLTSTMKLQCKVTFKMNGHGTAPADQTVWCGDKLAVKPADPKSNGYIFTGWYTDEALTQKFDVENDTISGDTTLYAKWEPIPDHELTVKGGTFTFDDSAASDKGSVYEGAVVTVTLDENDPLWKDDGLSFDHWDIQSKATLLDENGEEIVNPGKTFTFVMPEEGVTVEAVPKTAAAEDDSWDAATVVTGVVLGTGTAILAYHIGTELYAEQVLGEGVAVPKTREDVALKAWELAGKPAVELNGEPLSVAAQAEKWAVESGLMQNDANGNFNGAKKMNKLKALRVLDNAKKMNAQ